MDFYSCKRISGWSEDVNEMIHVANSSVVRDEDILGENCYYYDSKSEEIRIGK